VKNLIEAAGIFLLAVGGSALDSEGVIAVVGFAAMALLGLLLISTGVFLEERDELEDWDEE
jgi:hypothetical protein